MEAIKILLIEDNEGDRRLIKEMLIEAFGERFEFQSAQTVAEGLEKLDSNPDLVLADLSLPDSSGLDTFYKLYQKSSKTPIVVLSGLSNEEVAVKALKQGAQDYLVKGQVEPNLLRRAIRYAIERKQIQESLRIKELVIDSSINPIAIANLTGALTYANESFVRLWGYKDSKQVLNRSLEDFWDRSSEAEWIIATVLDEGNWQGRICARKNDDNRMELQLSSFVVKNYDKTGEPIYIVFSFVDITELNTLRRRLDSDTLFLGLVGLEPKMLEIYEVIRQAACVNAPVLIQGETGTGKELAARAIHKNGHLAQKPFVCIDCRKTEDIEKLFTGAAFNQTEGGTLFLKEIAALDKTAQKKLLDMLQEGSQEGKADMRLISSSSSHLALDVSDGNFLDELFYRICVIPLHMPPLRQRRSDIAVLSDYLLRETLETSEKKNMILSGETIEVLRDYDWPGNVKELKNTILYAISQAKSGLIMPRHLPEKIRRSEEHTS